jgi:NAD-dependent DNA ligase
MGFMRCAVSDRHVSAEECEALAKWILENQEVREIWPVSVVADRVNAIYADGIATGEERDELLELLQQVTGKQDGDPFANAPTDLPLTRPEPTISFPAKEFVFTGKFICGTRKFCQKQVEVNGGIVWDGVRKTTDYVVIGSLVSRDWSFTSMGTKIMKAVEYQKRYPLAIVSEKHWQSHLAAR